MAENRAAVRSRYSYGNRNEQSNQRRNAQMYVYGNVVPKPDYEPARRSGERRRRNAKNRRRQQQNQSKALHMSRTYVFFLAIAAIAALAVCIYYVNLQTNVTRTSKNISRLQADLENLREENNAKYNAVMDSVNLDEVRDRAVNDLHMTYATSDQVVGYKKSSADYVKQYENIPEDGVLAQSDRK